MWKLLSNIFVNYGAELIEKCLFKEAEPQKDQIKIHIKVFYDSFNVLTQGFKKLYFYPLKKIDFISATLFFQVIHLNFHNPFVLKVTCEKSHIYECANIKETAIILQKVTCIFQTSVADKMTTETLIFFWSAHIECNIDVRSNPFTK